MTMNNIISITRIYPSKLRLDNYGETWTKPNEFTDEMLDFNETNLYGFIESSKANTNQKGYKCCIML